MQRLPAVEEAKALLTEAMGWPIWTWLMQKGKVRETADKGTAALDKAEEKVKAGWNKDLKKAYRELQAQAASDKDSKAKARRVDPKIKGAAQRVKEADDEAHRARMDAEDTFGQAERRMSAGLAREGAQKAIAAYDLREKAIRKAEAVARLSSRAK